MIAKKRKNAIACLALAAVFVSLSVSLIGCSDSRKSSDKSGSEEFKSVDLAQYSASVAEDWVKSRCLNKETGIEECAMGVVHVLYGGEKDLSDFIEKELQKRSRFGGGSKYVYASDINRDRQDASFATYVDGKLLSSYNLSTEVGLLSETYAQAKKMGEIIGREDDNAHRILRNSLNRNP